MLGGEAMEQGTPTSWGTKRQGQVRTQEESNKARGTHILETAEGGTNQNTT